MVKTIKHTKDNCSAGNIFISTPGLQCGNCMAQEQEECKHTEILYNNTDKIDYCVKCNEEVKDYY